VSRRIPALREMLAELVAIPSVSSPDPALDQPNEAVVARLAEWLEALGFAVEVLPVPGRPGKANLVATLGRGPGGLVLAGHTDTVPFDAGRWSSDPFRLTERSGRLHGLGTADMKGFFPLALEVAAELDARRLRAPLVVLATADEESTMSGARALAAAGRPLGRHAVIGEPTGLRPVRAHKGILMERLRLVGRPGHSSDPALGNSALEGMHELIGAVLAWRAELQAAHRDGRFAVPVPTLNLGAVHGGDSPNRICGACALDLDLRMLPGMDPAALRERLRALAGEVAARRGLALECEALFEGVPALETPATAAIVRAAEALTGHAAEAVAFATEAPFLAGLGCETVVLGPGDIAQAHQPDESLALDRIGPMLRVLRGLVRRFCLEAGAP